jgi:hypothetical protein
VLTRIDDPIALSLGLDLNGIRDVILGLDPGVSPPAIPQDERTSVVGAGGFDCRGTSRDPGLQSLSVDLNISWLEPGSYVMVLDVCDTAPPSLLLRVGRFSGPR